MEKAGAELVMHYKEMAFMGFWEVIKNIFKIRALLNGCKKDLLLTNPDVLILIDYPGFNLRMAKFAREKGFKVFYYISPKIWAWNSKRAYSIKKNVDRMFVILPFEKEFYQSYNYKVDYVGNPLVDAIDGFEPDPEFRVKSGLGEKAVIAVLPGSRKQEIGKILDQMISLSSYFPQFQFVVAGVRNLDPSFYEQAVNNSSIKVVFDQTYELLSVAYAALVTSGTATLETAIFKVPQVVCYKSSFLSYYIARAVIKVKFISLVNLIANKEVVRELIQYDFNQEELKKQLIRITSSSHERSCQLEEYGSIIDQLGHESPSKKAASLMLGYLNPKNT